jgi:hypothetical protein
LSSADVGVRWIHACVTASTLLGCTAVDSHQVCHWLSSQHCLYAVVESKTENVLPCRSAGGPSKICVKAKGGHTPVSHYFYCDAWCQISTKVVVGRRAEIVLRCCGVQNCKHSPMRIAGGPSKVCAKAKGDHTPVANKYFYSVAWWWVSAKVVVGGRAGIVFCCCGVQNCKCSPIGGAPEDQCPCRSWITMAGKHQGFC